MKSYNALEKSFPSFLII